MTEPQTRHPGAAVPAREAALRRVLRAIRDSRDDEAPVFAAILESACELCAAPFAGLYLVDACRRTVAQVASRGARSAYLAGAARRWPLDDPTSISTAVRTGRIVHAGDLADSDLYRSGHAQRVEAVEIEGIRTFLAVPLIDGDRAIGAIGLYRREAAPFGDDHVALVETFAEQAVIAIENVRQFREVQTRLERERAMREVLNVISQSRDDERPVFDAILESATRLCDAPLGFLSIVNEQGTHFTVPSHHGAGPAMAAVWDRQIEPIAGSDLTTALAITGRQVLHVDDLSNDPAFGLDSPRRAELVDLEQVRTYLVIPLLKGDHAIGTINLYRREVQPFRPEQIALVETFAAQAVIAIENVRQFREVQMRLERERASREILEVISRNPEDVQPVFEVIVRNAAGLCATPDVGLHMANDARTHSRLVCVSDADRGVFQVGLEFDLNSPLQTPTAIRESRMIHNPDIADDPLYRSRDPVRVRLVEVDGVRSRLSVPLLKNGIAIGCINLNRHEVRPFADSEIGLIETFAAQAVIAIENVRQFREVQMRLEREAATREILEVISRSRDDEAPVFEAILQHARRLCDAPFAALVMARPGDAHQAMVAHFGAKPSTEQIYASGGVPMDPDRSFAARAIYGKRVIHLNDMADTDEYRAGIPNVARLVDEQGIRTNLFVPLITTDGGIGCFILFRHEVRPFSGSQIALVETFAEQAVIAIENVRQFRALRDRTAEVEGLNASLESRVTEQVDQLERMGRLKRFLSPQVADAVVSSGEANMLGSHRALIAILFCDIRGFTAFCESAEPEEAIEVLQTYHQALGRLIQDAGAGFDHRAGDGIMVVFNDPVPCDDPAGSALRLAVAMRARMEELCAGWRRLGHRLGFGVGIALGYATVGMVGFEGRHDYTASGTAVNLASRLCDQAGDGDILLSARAAAALEGAAGIGPAGQVTLKGFHAPVEVFRVLSVAGRG